MRSKNQDGWLSLNLRGEAVLERGINNTFSSDDAEFRIADTFSKQTYGEFGEIIAEDRDVRYL